MTKRAREILDFYRSENAGVLSNLARMINHGRLAGTGTFVILPVDQGFEHGPARSFAPNPPAYDPRYHFSLAFDAGCNAYAAPLGFLEAGAAEFAGEIPLILKLNNHDLLHDSPDPEPAVTGSVRTRCAWDAPRSASPSIPVRPRACGCTSSCARSPRRPRRTASPSVVWSYPRGSGISKEGETAIDVVAYAAQIAAQLGANIIKVKLPTAHLEQPEAKKVYENQPRTARYAGRRACATSCRAAFDGRRIVIFSGGPKVSDEKLLDEVRAIKAGGGFGSIIGRNSFQRPRAEAIKLLGTIMDIYAGASAR